MIFMTRFFHAFKRSPLIHVALLLVSAAFLAGSISFGSELTQKSHLKTVIGDAEKFSAAYQKFNIVYNALPGDISNASSYWRNCRSNWAECNGDNNHQISSKRDDNTTESALAWQHLHLAGLTEKPMAGSLIAELYLPGENIPAGPYADSGYLFVSNTPYKRASTRHSHFLSLGGMSDWQFNNATVTISDASAIDAKLDDGAASQGMVTAFSDEASGCVDSYEREVLMGRLPTHYASKEARPEGGACQLYFQLN